MNGVWVQVPPSVLIRAGRLAAISFSTTNTPRGERTDDLPSKVRQIWLITPVNPRRFRACGGGTSGSPTK